MSNLALQVPEYLQAYLKPGKDGERGGWAHQHGELTPQDFGLNFIKIVHPNTKYVRNGWGPTKQEPAMAAGTMFLSRDGTLIPPGAKFVPLYRDVRYIKWIGRPGEGRIDFMCNDKHDPRIKACKGLDFIRDPQTGNTIAPAVTTYINIYVFCQYCEAPVILSFKRTGIPDGRKFTQDMAMATKAGALPYFSLTFKLNQPKEVIDGNLQWYLYSLQPDGFTQAEVLKRAEALSKMAEDISNMATEEDYSAAETDEPGHGGPKPTEGAVVTTGFVNSPPAASIAVPAAPQAPAAPAQQPAPVITAPPAATAAPAPAPQGTATVKLW